MKALLYHSHSSALKSSRVKGFTLVELLVVIVIIAALAGIVIAMVGRIKANAQRANALSTLRQVSTFSVAYSGENSGDINVYKWPTDKFEGKPSWVKDTFWGRVQPYLFPDVDGTDRQVLDGMRMGIERLFNSSRGQGRNRLPKTFLDGKKIFSDGTGLPLPFAFNSNLHAFNRWVKVSQQPDPAQVVYLTYGSAHFDSNDGATYAPMPLIDGSVTNNIFYLDDRKAIMAFLDGHIETLSPPIVQRRFGVPPPPP